MFLDLVKKKQFLWGVLAVLILIVGGYKTVDFIQHNEMNQIVNSEEVKEIYLKRLTSIDPDAFTEKGKYKNIQLTLSRKYQQVEYLFIFMLMIIKIIQSPYTFIWIIILVRLKMVEVVGRQN